MQSILIERPRSMPGLQVRVFPDLARGAMARQWLDRTTRNSFIEPALHNDSSIGDKRIGAVEEEQRTVEHTRLGQVTRLRLLNLMTGR